MLERGWFQNTDKRSFCFDLKWYLHPKDINWMKLRHYPKCIVNHFKHNGCLTTKVGLC